MTEKKIKVFFLEDNLDDVGLELYQLKKGGLEVTYEVARNRKEFLEKIQDINVDIILADYALPDITGIEAIHICRERKIDIPIIFITGVGSEEVAVDSLREGAIDYILKKNIVGLPGRISRALEIWAEHKAKEKAERERQQLQQELFQAQKMESIGRLAGGIAHDFNNILTGIIGYAELALQDIPEESPVKKRIEAIFSMSTQAAKLIRELLIFARRIPMEPRTINLNSFIEDTIPFIKRLIEDEIEIRLFLGEIPQIKVDLNQLTQVLMNLATNARDAMNGKGVLTFKTEICPLAEDHSIMDLNAGDVCIRLSVSDTGCGISQDDILKISDPFFTTKERDKAVGLGLAIVYSILRSHGGWISVDSEIGKGTTFKIHLPSSPNKS